MIADAEELAVRVREAGAALQEISDFVKEHPRHAAIAKVRFPRGYLRTAAGHRNRLAFVANPILRDNVSYALMTHDVLRWISSRTDLSGQALEMITKEAVCLLGTVCESISIYPNYHGLGRGAGFSRRVQRLVEMGIIDAAAQERLNWLWAKRNQEHLIDVLFREWDHYTGRDWSLSVDAYHALRDGLTRWHAAGFPRRGLLP
jgi:hypothetical protein